MTARERLLAVALGGEADRIPVAPYMGNFGAAAAGVPIDRYCRDGRLMAEAQWRAWELCGQDALVPQSDGYYLAEGFGLKVTHHEGTTPTPVAPLLEDLKGVDDLPDPEPLEDGRMAVYLEAIERLRDRTQEVAIRATGTGPFSLAGHLLGPVELVTRLALLEIEPDPAAETAIRRLMDRTTAALARFAKAALDAGADIVQAGDSLASLDMISPAIYEKWVWPYEQRFFAELGPVAHARGAVTLLHICGNTTQVLSRMAETGADILEIDHKVDMGEAARIVAGRTALMGNLDPSSVLLRGTPESVEREARRVIEQTGGRLVLGSGCEVSPLTPVENVRTLVRAARATG